MPGGGLMFLCHACHPESGCTMPFFESVMGSYGPCENCGASASCADCRGYDFREHPGQAGASSVTSEEIGHDRQLARVERLDQADPLSSCLLRLRSALQRRRLV